MLAQYTGAGEGQGLDIYCQKEKGKKITIPAGKLVPLNNAILIAQGSQMTYVDQDYDVAVEVNISLISFVANAPQAKIVHNGESVQLYFDQLEEVRLAIFS